MKQTLFILALVLFGCQKTEINEVQDVFQLEEIAQRNDPGMLDLSRGEISPSNKLNFVQWGDISQFQDLVKYPRPFDPDGVVWSGTGNENSDFDLLAYSFRPNELRLAVDSSTGQLFRAWNAIATIGFSQISYPEQPTEIIWMRSADSVFVKYRPISQFDFLTVVYPYPCHQFALGSNEYPPANGTAICPVLIQALNLSDSTWSAVDVSNASIIEMYGNNGNVQFDAPLITSPPNVDTVGTGTIRGGEKIQTRDQTPLNEFGWFRLSGFNDGCDSTQWEMGTYYQQMIWQFHAIVHFDQPGFPETSEGFGWGWVRREDENCVQDGLIQPFPIDWAGDFLNSYGDTR